MDEGYDNKSIILRGSIIGFPTGNTIRNYFSKNADDTYRNDTVSVSIGNNALIRPNSFIYEDVEIGEWFECGHNVIIRERTKIGNNTRIGTNTVIEGDVEIGNNVNIQSCVYIPKHTYIGDNVFIAPCVVITNDKYPPHAIGGLIGATIEDCVSIGANSTILPGITIAEHSLVAAGSVVTRDVPPYSMAIGVPAKMVELPNKIKEKQWCK